MRSIEIISHPLCPMAQRLVLIALAKGWTHNKEFTVTYLPYANLREAAPLYSPGGELPVLRIDGARRTATAEHAAEYLDTVAGTGLLPLDPDERLRVREREGKVRSLLDTMRTVFASPGPEALEMAVPKLFDHLDDMDADLGRDGTAGQMMRMDMAALAPAFSLIMFFKSLREHPLWDKIPRLRGIAERSAANPLVLASRCQNYGFEFDEFFKMTNSAFPAHFSTSQ